MRSLILLLFWFFVGFAYTGFESSEEVEIEHADTVYSLHGEWYFQLDSLNVGIRDRWYSRLQNDRII
jgi:hypothetical protein